MDRPQTESDINNSNKLNLKIEDSVATPFGYMDKSKVHHLESGYELKELNGRLFKINSKSKKIESDFGIITEIQNSQYNTKQQQVSTLGTGWITDAYWSNNSGTPIKLFSTNWIVPNAPTTNHGQLIYLFNGIQDGLTSTSHILQPVLQWRTSPAGGGNYWAITNWYVSGSNAFYGQLIPVSIGTNLQGVIQLTAQKGNLYSYLSSFAGYNSNSSVRFPKVRPVKIRVNDDRVY